MWFLLTDELLKMLNKFYKRKEMQKIAADQGLDGENNIIISTGWHNGLVLSSNIFFVMILLQLALWSY